MSAMTLNSAISLEEFQDVKNPPTVFGQAACIDYP